MAWECGKGPNHQSGHYALIKLGTVAEVIHNTPLNKGYFHTKNEKNKLVHW